MVIIIWINAELLSFRPLGTSFNETWNKILKFSLKISSTNVCHFLKALLNINCTAVPTRSRRTQDRCVSLLKESSVQSAVSDQVCTWWRQLPHELIHKCFGRGWNAYLIHTCDTREHPHPYLQAARALFQDKKNISFIFIRISYYFKDKTLIR